VAVFGVFVLLYLRAYRKRRELDLNKIEIFDARNSIQESLLNCSIGILSVIIATFGGRYSMFAGPVYMLVGVVLTVHGFMMGKQRRRLENAANATPVELGS
jgi:hypothetical protein